MTALTTPVGSAAQHTPGQICDNPAADDLQCQLHWAEHHANDYTIAEHNRTWFATEALRIRAAIAKAQKGGAS